MKKTIEKKMPSPGEALLARFEFQHRTRLVFGAGTIERLGEFARLLEARNVLLVTDPGVAAAGHAERVRELLEKEGLRVICFDQVQENPGTKCVGRCVEVAAKAEINLIVGLGGGSSMDTAKGCNFILTNGGRIQDYLGVGKAKRPMLPLIAIPTTGGTGSECQSFALISDEKTHQKMACGDPKAAARIAILDPVLTVSQPPRVTACSGIDAVSHAVETAVTKRRNPISVLFSRESFRLTSSALPRVLQNPNDLDARGQMLLGAAYAGIAIENSMLGAAHSAANPLTAHFGVAHGQAVGLMLPHVVRFNAAQPEAALNYSDLVAAAGLSAPENADNHAAEKLAAYLKTLLNTALLADSLSGVGVSQKDLPRLAQEAAKQWTAQFNPVPVSAREFEAIYTHALG